MGTFKIGISMAGAISAGAYTAGVLDFLTEALDEWYAAKARGEAVPAHDVLIEVLSGASAGGMCAAIAAVTLQEDFEHIHDTNKSGTTNRFYESWVNRIDIGELLKTADLREGQPVASLLDSTVINDIARYALTPGRVLAARRPYVSSRLTLFLSLTNLRGTPYSLNGAAPGSIEEMAVFFGDRMRFETVSAGTACAREAYPLDNGKPGAEGGWDVLQQAAMATGAFPLFLAPRVLERRTSDYTPPLWEPVASAMAGTPPPLAPSFPLGMKDPLETLNVDGGVTNNDPFNYAHDYLVSLEPAAPAGQMRSSAKQTDRAVISVAPFPTVAKFEVAFDAARNAGLLTVLGRLFGALLAQSRFFGESLQQIMNGTTFSRFVIAPSDPELASRHNPLGEAGQMRPPTALQCGVLGAFGGFFERGFRAHDYALGRRNCQKFLTDHFVLPADNVVMEAGLERLSPAERSAVIERFRRPAPGTYAEPAAMLRAQGRALPETQQQASEVWLPVVPLCSAAVSQPLAPIERQKLNAANLDRIVSLILARCRALVPLFLAHLRSAPLRAFLQLGQPFIRMLARGPLRKTLIRELGDSFQA